MFKNNEIMERWKDIKGYEGYYQISNKGRVRSMARDKWNGYGVQSIDEKILNCSKGGRPGYHFIHLWKNGKHKKKYIHDLVLEAFVSGEKKECVNHKDGDKINNNVENLEYCTYSQNLQHAYDIGLRRKNKGELAPRAKLNEREVMEIRNNIGIISQRKMAKKYGVSKRCIQSIIERKSWKHIL